MQKGESSRRLGKQQQVKQAGGWAEVGPSWSAQPISKPSRPPFDLATIQTIYSPKSKSHEAIHSSSTVEEQRREEHHLREERIELVD
jgi:hypothetical protein